MHGPMHGKWLSIAVALLVAQQAGAAAPAALAEASMRGDLPAMKALLKAGSAPDAPGPFGTPALHWRVDMDDLAGARLLLQAGADANARTDRGISPLSLAIANGNAAMVG